MKIKNRLWNSIPTQIAITALVISAVTLIALAFRQLGFSEISIAVVYTLCVLIIARVTRGYVYGLIASVVNILCFNYFFTEPYYTLHVYNKNYFTAFIVMLLASFLTSTLTSKILDSSTAASKSEELTRMLYQITSSLAKASGVAEVASVSVRCISNLMDCNTCFITLDENEVPNNEYDYSISEHKVNVFALSSAKSDDKLEDKFILPIANQANKYGVIYFPEEFITAENDQIKQLHSISVQICVAMERERLTEEKKKIEAQAEREKFKSNLLRAISHDLRTPLAGISGAAEILQYNLSDGENRRLAKDIYDDANWLTHMVENILSLTKIEEGKMIQNIQLEAVEEIVAEAVKRASKYAENRTITVKIPDEVLFVPMDGKLIVQVLINLIDNAVKHTNLDNEICVEIRPENRKVWFSVIDHGTGIPDEDIPRIFDLFYRAEHTRVDSRHGIGLGLTICKSIVDAHGGSIFAQNNAEGGATVRFWLPYQGSVEN